MRATLQPADLLEGKRLTVAPRNTDAVAKPILTPQAEDFPRWYQDVIAKAQLAENGPARGTMVIRPWAYAIWERIQAELDTRIKRAGARNAYFPLLIPESFMHREAEHVEGFSPELAVVTHGGGKQLEEPLVIRPTSETIVGSCFARWIDSYRDLPMLVNNWSNIVRWELRPRLFLRTTEFLWQEGHTAHETEEEARLLALTILHDVYEEVMRDVLAIPVYTGLKTERERFAGAVRTWTCEGVMRDGKALQMGTSHELGHGFARAFGIEFTDRDGQRRHPWQTSWGATTRLIGALIMVHGDDRGLRLPPLVAPTQVAVVLVKDEGGAGEAAATLARDLETAGVRAELDDRVDVSFGRRAVDWELRGVPLRVEVGPRELADGRVTMISRARDERRAVGLEAVVGAATAALEADQAALLAQATELRDSRTAAVKTVEEAIGAAQDGLARLPWAAVGDEGEDRLAGAGVTVRCLVDEDALVGRAY
jgi:prolyl-tRNA synthetase